MVSFTKAVGAIKPTIALFAWIDVAVTTRRLALWSRRDRRLRVRVATAVGASEPSFAFFTCGYVERTVTALGYRAIGVTSGGLATVVALFARINTAVTARRRVLVPSDLFVT